MQQLLGGFIEEMPETVLAAVVGSGEEALEGLSDAVDLVLVDVSLPGISGIDLVAKIKARWPDQQCLMLSGHLETAYVERAFAAGARGYAAKGDAGELREAIECVLGGERFVTPALRERLQARQK